MSMANVKPRSGGRSQNNQQADGSVRIPAVLQPYMGGMKTIQAG